jgi:hypothetical protein
MKFIIAVAVFVSAASALLEVSNMSTKNECEADEGAFLDRRCFTFHYNLCRQFIIQPDSSCNFVTLAAVALEWTSDINVFYWGMHVLDSSATQPVSSEEAKTAPLDNNNQPNPS